MARWVLMVEVNGGWVPGRPRLGWMDCVKVELGNRGLTVEAARKSGEPGTYVTEWVSWAIFAWHCVLSDRPPMLWWLSHGEGRDAVGINCKNGATTENQGELQVTSSIWAKGCILMTVCVCVFYLTWHHYPSLVYGESHGILLLLRVSSSRCWWRQPRARRAGTWVKMVKSYYRNTSTSLSISHSWRKRYLLKPQFFVLLFLLDLLFFSPSSELIRWRKTVDAATDFFLSLFSSVSLTSLVPPPYFSSMSLYFFHAAGRSSRTSTGLILLVISYNSDTLDSSRTNEHHTTFFHIPSQLSSNKKFHIS